MVPTLACTPATLRVSLAWEPTGQVTRERNQVTFFTGGGSPVPPNFEHSLRCQFHMLPSRSVDATVSGRIDGLPFPLGELQSAKLGFAGWTANAPEGACVDD
jgi:hypothetical protein